MLLSRNSFLLRPHHITTRCTSQCAMMLADIACASYRNLTLHQNQSSRLLLERPFFPQLLFMLVQDGCCVSFLLEYSTAVPIRGGMLKRVPSERQRLAVSINLGLSSAHHSSLCNLKCGSNVQCAGNGTSLQCEAWWRRREPIECPYNSYRNKKFSFNCLAMAHRVHLNLPVVLMSVVAFQ